jgi:endo-1,4-beta-xylanase
VRLWVSLLTGVGLLIVLPVGCGTGGNVPLRDLADDRDLLIGAAVSAGPLRTDPRYAEVLGREFSFVTTENELKAGVVHPARDRYAFQDADDIVAFAEANDMAVRGHTLVWHQQMPDWLGAGSFGQAELEQILHDHITTVVGRYRGRIRVWDVVNEAVADRGSGLRQTLWSDGLGPVYIDKAFEWAHGADAEALLFYNDYGAEGMGAKSDRVYALVADMVARGVPIDGVGLQMHLTLATAPNPEDVLANMERLAELGLAVHITELDVRLPTGPGPDLRERQAAVYRSMLSACLQAPSCTAFTTWGFTDGYSWIPRFDPGFGQALIFDADYAPKPAYDALRLLLVEGPQ